MNRKLLVAAMSAALICGGSSLAVAQNAPPPPPAAPATQGAPTNQMVPHTPKLRAHGKHGWHGHRARGHHAHGHHSPAMAVIGTLHRLERLYQKQGKNDQIESMYRNVLKQTQNPRVRHFAYEHLARAQMQPKNMSAAISTLHKDLDESLKQLNQHDQMRAKWRAKMMQTGSH